eukprot:3627574-Ditylum_brightwellii.AAC.1
MGTEQKVVKFHALTGNTTTELSLKVIINAEDMSNMWKKIAYADKGKTDNNVSSISIPLLWSDMHTPVMATRDLEDLKKTDQWQKVKFWEEILYYLTVRNRQQFGKAHGAPFTVPPLSQYFDWSENSPISEL